MYFEEFPEEFVEELEELPEELEEEPEELEELEADISDCRGARTKFFRAEFPRLAGLDSGGAGHTARQVSPRHATCTPYRLSTLRLRASTSFFLFGITKREPQSQCSTH